MFIVDETYLLFSKDYYKKTLNYHASRYNNLIVVSSLTPKVEDLIKSNQLFFKKLASKKIFFEELTVYLISQKLK